MRIGIVGCGGMGNVHANKYLQMPEVELHSFDLDSARLAEFCKLKGAKPSSTFEELLDKCEAIDICLPTPLHVSTVIQCLEAGKPTLCEKPLARTTEQCRTMIDVAQRTGTSLVPAHVVRFFPEFARAHSLIKAGEIGKPASIRLRRGGGQHLDRIGSLISVNLEASFWILRFMSLIGYYGLSAQQSASVHAQFKSETPLT